MDRERLSDRHLCACGRVGNDSDCMQLFGKKGVQWLTFWNKCYQKLLLLQPGLSLSLIHI